MVILLCFPFLAFCLASGIAFVLLIFLFDLLFLQGFFVPVSPCLPTVWREGFKDRLFFKPSYYNEGSESHLARKGTCAAS